MPRFNFAGPPEQPAQEPQKRTETGSPHTGDPETGQDGLSTVLSPERASTSPIPDETLAEERLHSGDSLDAELETIRDIAEPLPEENLLVHTDPEPPQAVIETELSSGNAYEETPIIADHTTGSAAPDEFAIEEIRGSIDASEMPESIDEELPFRNEYALDDSDDIHIFDSMHEESAERPKLSFEETIPQEYRAPMPEFTPVAQSSPIPSGPPVTPAQEEAYVGSAVFEEDPLFDGTDIRLDSDPLDSIPGSAQAPEYHEEAVKHSRLPLVGFIITGAILVGVSAIWFLDPYPPLRKSLQDLINPNAPPVRTTSVSHTPPDVEKNVPTSGTAREWNYYLQVGAFNELYQAQADANRLKKLGINAKVEGDFIPTKRRTLYKVRLGPYPSLAAAQTQIDSLEGIIPATAFIDSIRVEADVADTSGLPPVVQPLIRKPAQTATNAGTQQLPGKQAPAQPVKASGGFAVHVSSFKSLESAQTETRSLITRGLPAYTSKASSDGTDWYRVLVGPFRSRQEADRYLEIVRKEFGNAAYVRSLSN